MGELPVSTECGHGKRPQGGKNGEITCKYMACV